MKHPSLFRILAAVLLAACNLSAQSLSSRPEILGSAVDPANDIIRVDDVSVPAANGQARQMKVGELANVPGMFTGLLATREPALGNPGTNGFLLSSTTAGVRSWVAPPTGTTNAAVVSAIAENPAAVRDSGMMASKATTFQARKAQAGFGFQTQPNVNDTVTVGSVTYTFVAGAPSSANQVQIAATAILTSTNFRNAIASGSGGGLPHPVFTATAANGIVGLLARSSGASSNGVVTSSSAPSRVLAHQRASYGGSNAVQTLSVADKFRDDSAYKNPLFIPAFDGLPSVTHPSVVFAPEGWNGYRYWMAYTPWPDGSREFPCIVASQNGVDWEVPAGLVNPLITVGTVVAQPSGGASNFGFAPDTHLVMMPDGTLAVFFLMAWATGEGGDAAMFRMTSSNGVSWGSLTRVIPTIANGRNAAHGVGSPAIYQVADGTWEMLGMTESDGPINKISRWTSPDTTTWTFQSQINLPTGVMEPWHLDALFVSGKWHLLVNAVGGRLYYFYSTDGLNYLGDADHYVSELVSGDDWDAGRNYRSCMVPRHGNPIAFDVWVSGLPSSPLDGVQPGGKPWSIGLFRNVTFKDITPITQDHNKRWLMPATTGMLYNSGTGSQAALIEGSVFRLSQGNTAAGYGLARLSRRTNTRESNFTNFSIPFSLSGKIMGGAAQGSAIRVLYGAPLGMDAGFTANAGSNPFTEKGIGLELSATGGTQLARLIYHDGTTARSSSWVNLGHDVSFVRSAAYKILNRGNGVLELYVMGGGNLTVFPKMELPDSASIVVTNGPTGTGATANNSGIWAVVTGDGVTSPGTVTCEFEAPILEWK